eukprot:517986_1
MEDEEEEKYPQQIELHINTSQPLTSNYQQQQINASNQLGSTHDEQDVNQRKFELKYIEYTLNDSEPNEINTITVSERSTPINDPNSINYIHKIWKYRSELAMNHRKQRYNIVLIPIYIIFITFSIFIGLSLNQRMNTNSISYFSQPINYQYRERVSESELESIAVCNLSYVNIYGWFDGESYDIDDKTWFDYSAKKNHINSTYIVNKIKLGEFYRNNNSNLYVYGSKFDSVQIPSLLSLNKKNYTIITIARYNGNDRNTIFISNDSKWTFGFQHNNTDILFHDGFRLDVSNEARKSLRVSNYEDDWIINIDSPQLFRSQQKTLYHDKNYTNNNVKDDKPINWGINIFNTSDWAIATLILVNHQLLLSEMQCIEHFLVNKYNLSHNENNDINDDNYVYEAKIHECDRWSTSNYDYITNWYDVNNGFDGNTLFDLSGHSNHISIAKNIKVGVHKYNFRYLYGSRNDIINIPNSISFNNDYLTAIYYIGRYNGNDKGSVMADGSNKFYFGFYQQNSGVCYLDGIKLSEFETNIYGDEWLLSSIYVDDTYHTWYCTQNCDTFFIDGSGLFETVQLNLSVNGEYDSDWALTEIIILKMKKKRLRFIPFRDSICIEQYLSNKYNINSYQYNIENV